MRKLFFLGLGYLSSLMALPAATVIPSPDGQLSFQLDQDVSGHLLYSVLQKGTAVVLPSRLGLMLDQDDLGSQVRIGSIKTSTINKSYPLLGGHVVAVDQDTDAVISLQGGRQGMAWTLEVRVFNQGIAYRYLLPGQGSHHLEGEVSSWNFPPEDKIWYQNDLGAYEGLTTRARWGN